MANSGEIARQNREVSDYQAPRTEYVLRLKKGQDYTTSDQVSGRNIPGRRRPVTTAPRRKNSGDVPQILSNQGLLTGAWLTAMIIISVDEWKKNRILPRPSRLWWTSALYGLLGLASIAEPLIPIINALAIGYTITLLWQYYNGTGQFAGSGGTSGGTGGGTFGAGASAAANAVTGGSGGGKK